MTDIESREVMHRLGPRLETTGNLLLSEFVFERLSDRIVTGSIAPGEKINDLVMAADLGVSRTPVREAIQRLHRVGLVAIFPSRITYITPLDTPPPGRVLAYNGFLLGGATAALLPTLNARQRAALSTLFMQMAHATEDSSSDAAIAHARLTSWLVARLPVLAARHLDEARYGLERLFAHGIFPSTQLEDLARTYQIAADAVRSGDAATAEHALRDAPAVREP